MGAGEPVTEGSARQAPSPPPGPIPSPLEEGELDELSGEFEEAPAPKRSDTVAILEAVVRERAQPAVAPVGSRRLEDLVLVTRRPPSNGEPAEQRAARVREQRRHSISVRRRLEAEPKVSWTPGHALLEEPSARTAARGPVERRDPLVTYLMVVHLLVLTVVLGLLVALFIDSVV
jgi:hypothetical protein